MKLTRIMVFAVILSGLHLNSLSAKTILVPLVYRETSGTRPYVDVDLDGKHFLFMVHANAGFTAMTTRQCREGRPA